MNFENFIQAVTNTVADRMGSHYSVSTHNVTKNNGVILTGLLIKQDDSNIAPTIYLNHYYEAYEKGDISLNTVINRVIETYRRNRINSSIDMKFFLNYETVKHRIIFKLINTEKNRELLNVHKIN